MDLTLAEQSKVFSFYMKHPICPGEAYISPIPASIRGKEDHSPSFSIFYNKEGDTLLFKDHGGNNENERSYNKKKLIGDCLVFMVLMDSKVKSHKQALFKYHTKIKDANIEYSAEIKKGARRRNKQAPPIMYRETKFKDFELEWWDQYNICRKQLIDEYIYGSDGIKVKSGVIFESSPELPAFIYDLNYFDPLKTYQIYNPECPKELKMKWRLWADDESISQSYYTTLPEQGETFLLASSKKDMLCIKNSGYFSDAPLSESNRFRFLSKYKDYDRRFKNKYILFDGDKDGLIYAKTLLAEIKKIHRHTQWKVIKLNYPTGTKDVADIVKAYGQDCLSDMLYKLKL